MLPTNSKQHQTQDIATDILNKNYPKKLLITGRFQEEIKNDFITDPEGNYYGLKSVYLTR
ncbi:hypothetical protein [Natranaerobius trueperi]|uniref:hypothetical protein n=1 Tax=Natranaerobius trueperi TaxID=759412 RepID=UPI001303DB5A|nr:hypothetical protein [Natranaerobius trueperi]